MLSSSAVSLSSTSALLSEVEMKEKKARVEDALNATRAAVEEGIVPGGGTALLRASRALTSLKGLSPEQQAGVNIIRRALEEPLRQIAGNAGHEGSIVVDKVINNTTPSWGFNALTETYEDLIAAGVIDPTKVARCALQNAASVASLMLTTETLIAEKPKKEFGSSYGWRNGWHGRHGRHDVMLGFFRASAKNPFAFCC